MTKRIKIVPRGRKPRRTNWAALIISAILCGLIAGKLTVSLPRMPWDTGSEPALKTSERVL